MDWMIDKTIDATAICEASKWHLATVIGKLVEAGLTQADADAFANYIFADAAGDVDRDEYITEALWQRLSLLEG